MKQQFIPIKFLIAVWLLPVAFLLVVAVTTILPNYFKGGNTDFQPIEPETALYRTNYLLEYTHQNVTLWNRYSYVSVSIVRSYSPVALPPAYHLLHQPNGRDYVIIRLASGGNSGAFWFRVFEITSDTARDVAAGSYDPDMGLSCTYPYVDGNALVLTDAANCADSPALYYEYRMPLT